MDHGSAGSAGSAGSLSRSLTLRPAARVAEATRLECDVCSEHYSATDLAHQPMTFTACGHPICKSCAERLHARRGTGLRCHLCNALVGQPPFVKNFALITALENQPEPEPERQQPERQQPERLQPVLPQPVRPQAVAFQPASVASIQIEFRIVNDSEYHNVQLRSNDDVDVVYPAIVQSLPSLRITPSTPSLVLADTQAPSQVAQKKIYRNKLLDPARPRTVADKGLRSGATYTVVPTHEGGGGAAAAESL
eukprot:m.40957 g.40957  ORF g.40957 m.40957 type:complete len:251 (-) comp11951_c0_seq2:147-899(-)